MRANYAPGRALRAAAPLPHAARTPCYAAELIDLAPELTDDLLNSVDQPLQVAKDAQHNMYLQCDYNRDGDSYRSPWTNAYDPPMDDGVLPSDQLRAMETSANELFRSYLEMYYAQPFEARCEMPSARCQVQDMRDCRGVRCEVRGMRD